MEFLQVQQQMNFSKEGMYISAISALVAAIVWLALYIRRLHNKTVEYLKEDKEKMIQVISKNTSAAEQSTRSNEKLSETIEDLHKTILIENRRRQQ